MKILFNQTYTTEHKQNKHMNAGNSDNSNNKRKHGLHYNKQTVHKIASPSDHTEFSDGQISRATHASDIRYDELLHVMTLIFSAPVFFVCVNVHGAMTGRGKCPFGPAVLHLLRITNW